MTLINKISTDVERRASNEQNHNDNVNVNVAATICNSTAILAPYAINTNQPTNRPTDRPSTLSWRRSTSRRLICRRRSLSVVCRRRYWWYNGTLMGFSGFTYTLYLSATVWSLGMVVVVVVAVLSLNTHPVTSSHCLFMWFVAVTMFVVVVAATTVDLVFVAATVDSAVNAVYFLISLHMRITYSCNLLLLQLLQQLLLQL